jgi:hypothetical protein
MNKYLSGKAYFFSGAFYANGFLGVFDIVARISFPGNHAFINIHDKIADHNSFFVCNFYRFGTKMVFLALHTVQYK